MLDEALRIAFLLLVAGTLVLLAVWFATFCYREVLGRREVVIDPFTVVDEKGKPNTDIGRAMALNLQSRLQTITLDLRNAQQRLTESPANTIGATPVPRVGDVRLWTGDVVLQTVLLETLDMKLSVGGLDVGGVLPWVQRKLSSRRTLHFTVFSHATTAQVFGSVAPLGLEGSIRLTVDGENEHTPDLDVIVERLACEIVHLALAKDSTNKVGLLRPEEFRTLTQALISAADSNVRAVGGGEMQGEFQQLLPGVTLLSDRVPGWLELSYFAGWVADRARNAELAATYYRRVRLKLDTSSQGPLLTYIDERLNKLEPAEPPAAPARAKESLANSVDYTSSISRVRNSGEEGSVVGFALATALEYQITKATAKTVSISPRYIYNLARAADGNGATDSGTTIKGAIQLLSSKGAVEDNVWPYKAGQFAAPPPPAVATAKKYKITNVSTVQGVDAVKQALSQTGPLVAGITMYASAMSESTSKSGLIPVPKAKESILGGHAVVLVGYDDRTQRVKFVNSWGSGWGDHGFGYLPYNFLSRKDLMSEAWTFSYDTSGNSESPGHSVAPERKGRKPKGDVE